MKEFIQILPTSEPMEILKRDFYPLPLDATAKKAIKAAKHQKHIFKDTWDEDNNGIIPGIEIIILK